MQTELKTLIDCTALFERERVKYITAARILSASTHRIGEILRGMMEKDLAEQYEVVTNARLMMNEANAAFKEYFRQQITLINQEGDSDG